ncbi:band 4.1-like protein 3a isoform X12 [Mobula hypostoma]|uniref:band 4.1-like protein 3a isoform X12 n=1 Tax=Mobula hypostoma TaxID=723540 RepID=UPI002FC3D355
MTTEPGTDSESKQDQEQKEASEKKETVTEQQESAGNQQADGIDGTPAGINTSEKKEKTGECEKEADGASGKVTVGQQEDYQTEDDKLSQKSSSSKLSKSPLKVVKKPKNMLCKVTLLDGSEYTCEVEKRAKGQVLFDKVCGQLNLLEKDYFGLTFRDSENQKNWLDPAKEIKKQIRSGLWQFAFNVKFYPPDPAQLSEDITRYYLCLQLRDDVVSGRLPCSFATHVLLGSYTVQAELGDYDPDEYGTEYISEFRFAPNETKELEEKIIELHKTHKGMSPAEAEMHYLENAKKLSMYGVDLHHAKDSEGVDIMLGVCASGLLIYRDRLRINRFAWPKVLKISYKRNNFYIKIRPSEVSSNHEQFESTIGFKLPNHKAAKRLWKVCIEHHTFFRLVSPEPPPKKFLTLGSKFRYSGRTQAQTRRASSLIDRPAPYFERSSSKRYTMSRSLDGASVTENHEMVIKDSISASEVATGHYGAAKSLVSTNLITTVTPEKKAEEEKAEEEDKKAKTDITPSLTPAKHEIKTDSEQTDTTGPADGETTAESDQEDEMESKTQSSLVERIKGENVYVKHSNLMLEEYDKTQEEVVKHHANINEMKRTFLESTAESGPDEWEKRLSASPIRSFSKNEDLPMIEPLVPEEQTKADVGETLESKPVEKQTVATSDTVMKEDARLAKAEDEHKAVDKEPSTGYSTVVTNEIVINKTVSSLPEKYETSVIKPKTDEEPMFTIATAHYFTESSGSRVLTKQSGSEVTSKNVDVSNLLDSARKQMDGKEWASASSYSWVQKPDVDLDEGSKVAQHEILKQEKTMKIVQETMVMEKKHVMNVHASEDASALHAKLAGVERDSLTEASKAHSSGDAGGLSSMVTVETKEEQKEAASPKVDQPVADIVEGPPTTQGWEEQPGMSGKPSEKSEEQPQFEPPVVKTETVSFESLSKEDGKEICTKDVPVVHTETKTITYESAKLDSSVDSDPGVLMSAQTITSETSSTTTTTHITKIVKGGISETRIEKRIVITGDADIDHDQALAQAIKEAKEQHPDMSVKKVVVHKETEITPEDGDD